MLSVDTNVNTNVNVCGGVCGGGGSGGGDGRGASGSGGRESFLVVFISSFTPLPPPPTPSLTMQWVFLEILLYSRYSLVETYLGTSTTK